MKMASFTHRLVMDDFGRFAPCVVSMSSAAVPGKWFNGDHFLRL